jgi:AcrR family transcriptional regulator
MFQSGYRSCVVGLRKRRHQQTKELLIEAAFALFLEHGFENVTMEQVAVSAGVSRSTAYRRFPTKEDVVLEAPRQWLGVFDQALSDLADGATLGSAVEATALAVAHHIDDHRDFVYAAYKILEESPSLQQTGIATAAWLDRYVTTIRNYTELEIGDTLTIAGAYLGAIDAVMQNWASTGGTGSVTAAITIMLKRLAPVLPDAKEGEEKRSAPGAHTHSKARARNHDSKQRTTALLRPKSLPT